MKKLLTVALLVSLFTTVFAVSVAFAQDPTTDPSTDTGSGTEAQQTDVVTPTVAADPTDAPADVVTPTVTAEPTDDTPADVVTPTVTAEPTDDTPADVVTPTVTAEPTDEATPEPTDEATPEPTDEATPEPTVEPTVEATPEPTEEPVVVEAPVITAFTASPDVLTAPDSSVTLSWVVSGTATLDLNGEDVTGLASKVVTVTETSAFTLTASNEGGSAQAGLTVAVVQPAEPTTSAGEIEVQAIPGTWNTNWYIQNAGTTAANGQMRVFDTTGTEKQQIPFSSLASGVALQTQATDITASGFSQGSVVIESDQPLAAVGEIQVSDGTYTNYAHYSGYSTNSIGTLLYLPGLVRNYFGWSSLWSVQNANGAQLTNVQVDYLDTTGTVVLSDTITLESGSSKYYDMTDGNHTALGSSWVGAVRITSPNGNVAATGTFVRIGQIGGTFYRNLRSFDAFTGGAKNWSCPTSYVNGYPTSAGGWGSSLEIQNLEGAQATVDVTFTPDSNYAATASPYSTSYNIPANGSFAKWLPAELKTQYAAGFAGAISISSNRNIVVTVGHTQSNFGPFTGSYDCFTTGASEIYYPVVYRKGSPTTNLNSNFAVQNMDASQSTDITFYLYEAGGTSPTYTGVVNNKLAAGSSLDFYLPALASGAYNSIVTGSGSIPADFTGSVKIVSSNPAVQLAGVAGTQNRSFEGKADVWMIYNAVAP